MKVIVVSYKNELDKLPVEKEDVIISSKKNENEFKEFDQRKIFFDETSVVPNKLNNSVLELIDEILKLSSKNISFHINCDDLLISYHLSVFASVFRKDVYYKNQKIVNYIPLTFDKEESAIHKKNILDCTDKNGRLSPNCFFMLPVYIQSVFYVYGNDIKISEYGRKLLEL